MDSKFLSESDFKALNEQDLKGGFRFAYFKLVDVAPSAREKVNGDAETISEIVDNVSGYYIFSSNTQDLRETLHVYVDNMIDAVEKLNDKK